MFVPVRVVFVLEVRLHRKGKRTKREHWEIRGAYLTQTEAEAAARAPGAGALLGWRVSAVPAAGVLAGAVLVEAA
ncbi:MAG TPA: hypothetical protein VGE74_04720 [Gemmata sp.]